MVSRRRTRRPLRPPAKAFKPSDPHVLLEQFSQENLAGWRRLSGGLHEYHTRLYYYLSGERSLVYPQLLECLQSAALASFEFSDHWRIVDQRYADVPLSPKGSLIVSGRFNYGRDVDEQQFKPFPGLYIASDHQTAMDEKFPPSAQTLLSRDELTLREKHSYQASRVRGDLHQVLDITTAENLDCFARVIATFRMPAELRRLASEARIRSELAKTKKDLHLLLHDPYWRRHLSLFDIPSNSQVFGRIALDAGLAAIRFSSVRGTGRNLVLFPQNFEVTDSSCELQDEAAASVRCARIDGETWLTDCG